MSFEAVADDTLTGLTACLIRKKECDLGVDFSGHRHPEEDALLSDRPVDETCSDEVSALTKSSKAESIIRSSDGTLATSALTRTLAPKYGKYP